MSDPSLIRRIEKDAARFRDIVRGNIRKNLKKYITRGELVGKKGKNLVSIPLPQIDIPHFRYGSKEQGGVGQGDGEVGQSLGKDGPGQGNEAGDQPGEHVLEVDISLDELARIMGDELELPRIEPKGKNNVQGDVVRYTGARRVGPESLRFFKRTYREALKRQLALGLYNPDDPVIYPIHDDRRYRARRIIEAPESRAVILYMMDVSGSMGYEQKEIVRTESFWIDTWLTSQYRQIETRYIVHDVVAKEVDRDTFFHIRESGGTKISSAYELADRMVEQQFNPAEWNVYLFHFSDGDNWGGDDTKHCLSILSDSLLPKSNLFCYGQVKSAYGSGQFIKDLREHFPKEHYENLVLSEINNKEEIYDSIKAFLGKGR